MSSFAVVLAIVVLAVAYGALTLADSPGPTRVVTLVRRYGFLGPAAAFVVPVGSIILALFSTTATFIAWAMLAGAVLGWCYRPKGWPWQNYGRPDEFSMRALRTICRNAKMRVYIRTQWPSVARTCGLVATETRGDGFGADLNAKLTTAARVQWEPWLSRGRATGPGIVTWRVHTARGVNSSKLIEAADTIAEAYRLPLVVVRPDRPGRLLLTAYLRRPSGTNSVIEELD